MQVILSHTVHIFVSRPRYIYICTTTCVRENISVNQLKTLNNFYSPKSQTRTYQNLTEVFIPSTNIFLHKPTNTTVTTGLGTVLNITLTQSSKQEAQANLRELWSEVGGATVVAELTSQNLVLGQAIFRANDWWL